MNTPIIKEHHGIYVVRDDLLPGGTKSILLSEIHKENPHIKEYVYASPVYGGFQIAISIFCKNNNIKATIFCAKRTKQHTNTLKCIEHGANVVEVPYGYLSVVEKKAREYCIGKHDVEKIIFGAATNKNKLIIAQRVETVLKNLHFVPDEIWCAVGSGTLISGILLGTNNNININVVGVQVGSEFKEIHNNLRIIKYPKSFDKESKIKVEFPSMPNYDLKAFELCLKESKLESNKYKKILFWNVL
jgi:threonine dehydratase